MPQPYVDNQKNFLLQLEVRNHTKTTNQQKIKRKFLLSLDARSNKLIEFNSPRLFINNFSKITISQLQSRTKLKENNKRL